MMSSPSLDPTQEGLDWLGRTTLDKLPGEVQRRLAEAFQRGVEEGYRRGYEAGGHAVEQQVRREAEERIADILAKQANVEAMGYRSGQEEAEARLRGEVERERREWLEARAEQERRQAEANLKEAEERMLAFERMMRDREKSLEQRIRAEIEAELRGQAPGPAAPSKAALDEAYQRGMRDASVVKAANDNGKLDAARKQAYQSGFEHGLAKAKRDSEGASRSQLDEARRQGYMEGLSEGRRGSLGIEGSRSWALGIMHLPDEATQDEVRQRFRKLSKLFHPDQNPDLGDAFIKNLQRARDILGD